MLKITEIKPAGDSYPSLSAFQAGYAEVSCGGLDDDKALLISDDRQAGGDTVVLCVAAPDGQGNGGVNVYAVEFRGVSSEFELERLAGVAYGAVLHRFISDIDSGGSWSPDYVQEVLHAMGERAPGDPYSLHPDDIGG